MLEARFRARLAWCRPDRQRQGRDTAILRCLRLFHERLSEEQHNAVYRVFEPMVSACSWDDARALLGGHEHAREIDDGAEAGLVIDVGRFAFLFERDSFLQTTV